MNPRISSLLLSWIVLGTGLTLSFSNAESVAANAAGEQLQTQLEAELAALRAEIRKAVPVIDERKKSAFQEAREAVKAAEAATKAAEESMKKIGAAQGLVEHHKNKWIGGAEKNIAAAQEALKKAATDEERASAEKNLAHWQTNLKEGEKALQGSQAALDAAKTDEAKFVQADKDAQAALTRALHDEMNAAKAILADVMPFLTGDQLDAQLFKCDVLADATPQGLAEFARQGTEEQDVVQNLLADTSLMKAMLEAGGAKGGKYGQAMKIYVDIQKASPRAKEGMLQRLALGTSLELTVPFQQGFSSLLSSTAKPVDPVKRYLHYEKAHLAGELDPAFGDLTTWELRFVSNDPSSDEELAWLREMLRNYRPDHVLNPDYKWRYVGIVKTDVGYGRKKWDAKAAIMPMQQVLRTGGICHIRAWAGRSALRAFGIPAWGTEQGGHTAVSHWTPEGWVVNLGAGWEFNWWDGRKGTDFLLETQARENPREYLKVLRTEWIATALGETNYNNMTYTTKQLRPPIEGLWNSLALFQKKAMVAAAKPAPLAAQDTHLGEADEPDEARTAGVVQVELTEADRQIVVDSNGVITIPAAVCDGVQPMKSFLGGFQAFCGGSITCKLDVMNPGKYHLAARVVTVSDGAKIQLTVNDAKDVVDFAIPDTGGKWEQTTPVEVTLVRGRNTLAYSKPARGFTIKDFVLTPVK